jgi:hypothetical protein
MRKLHSTGNLHPNLKQNELEYNEFYSQIL